jgi:hypothetical protein
LLPNVATVVLHQVTLFRARATTSDAEEAHAIHIYSDGWQLVRNLRHGRSGSLGPNLVGALDLARSPKHVPLTKTLTATIPRLFLYYSCSYSTVFRSYVTKLDTAPGRPWRKCLYGTHLPRINKSSSSSPSAKRHQAAIIAIIACTDRTRRHSAQHPYPRVPRSPRK